MEIGPILRAMMRNRTGAVLIALQVAFTLAIVVNSLFIMVQRIEKIGRPTGMDLPDIITVSTRGAGEGYNVEAAIRADLAALANLPGMVAATPINQFPLSGSGWGSELKARPGADAPRVDSARFLIDENGLDALGVRLESGRAFRPEEVHWNENFSAPVHQVIITRAMADQLFPDQPAQGATVYDGLDRPATVIGVLERMQGSWVGWENFENVMLVPVYPVGPEVGYLIRSEDGLRDTLMPQVEQVLAARDPDRVVDELRSLEEWRERSYARDRGMAILLAVVIGLLVLVTGLGIVGLASFVVRARTRQIGTRRALGARRLDILRYFLVENWLMTTMGVVLGTVLSLALNGWLVREYELPRLDPFYLPLTIAAMWLLGSLAVLGPARRAAAISPAIATRTV